MTDHQEAPLPPSNSGRVARGVRGLLKSMSKELDLSETQIAQFINDYIHWEFGKLEI